MKIAFLQMDCAEDDRQKNRACVREAAVEAARRGARILALPELWASGYDLARATCTNGWEEEFRFLGELSRATGLSVLGGSLLDRWDGGYANTAVAYENGEELTRYRKLHLFGPLEEDRYLRAGSTPPAPFPLAGISCAITICYDLRFPELYRPLTAAGVELIHVPAQWPRARVHHWRSLLIARAIECQCYVLGVNRRGWYGDLEFPGHSLLVDPRGDVLVDGGESSGLLLGEVDAAKVQEARRSFPIFEDRRTDLFPLPGELA